MQYTTRNTLFLSIAIITIAIIALSINFTYNKKLKKLNNELAIQSSVCSDIASQLKNLPDTLQIKTELEQLKTDIGYNGKIILKKENSDITYNYLNNLSKKYSKDIDFSFKSINTDIDGIKKINISSYFVSGTAPINSLFTFIYNIERQLPLYTIETFRLSQHLVSNLSNTESLSKTNYNKVDFSFTLNGYSKPKGIEYKNIRQKKLRIKRLAKNPFKAVIHPPYTIAKEEENLKIDELTIVALTPKQIFAKTPDGLMHSLKVGSKVAYGYLHNINTKQAKVTFYINKIGINTKVEKYLIKD